MSKDKREEEQEKRKKEVKVRKAEEKELLKEITVKIGLERIDIQKGSL